MADDKDLQEESVIILPHTMIEIQSQSPASDPYTGAWSTVNDMENPKIVFPPINHEGLDHISTASVSASSPHGYVKDINLDRVAPPPSPLPTPRPMMPTAGDATERWWEAGLHLLHFKVAAIVSTCRKFARVSYFPPLAGSLMVLLLLFLRFRRRRRVQREDISDLIRFVREKDEEKVKKINELVHQVARMNELLQALASQHRTRVA